MDYVSFFKGKKVTLMGLGLLGRGVGDAEFLAHCGAELIVTDLKTAEELRTSLERLKVFPNITYHLGGHRAEDFRGRDFILKAAGVPSDSPFIAEAVTGGIPVEMDASLFARLAPAVTLIGVTGTRGKSTTSALIYEILKDAGKRVFLAGNIRDTATLPLLSKVQEGDVVVLELDSWQLQGFGTSRLSPHIAVFTTFLPDHLNYYHGDMQAYWNDKANIFRFQKSGDHLVVGEDIADKYDWTGAGEVYVARRADVSRELLLNLPGEHNGLNVACAVEVTKLLKIPRRAKFQQVFRRFKGLAGRLELKKMIDGVAYYNDNNATTPDATIAGLRAVSRGKNIVLIMGGSDKGVNAEPLIAEIPTHCKAVVTIPGTGTDKLGIGNNKLGIPVKETAGVSEALAEARKLASKGDIVLFSPAFASFNQFHNEYERGEAFNQALSGL